MSDVPTPLRHWLPVLLSGRPHQVIGGDEHPYLRRWYVIPRNPLLNIYVHQFLRSDDDRALHDHPWWFVSLIVRGSYLEVTEAGTNRRRAGSIAFRPAEWRHRVQLDSNSWVSDGEFPCWTLIVTGRRRRMWGFWCKTAPWKITGPPYIEPRKVTYHQEPDRFIPWEQFGDAGCGEPS
jgi:hypothetical protein